MDFPAETEKPVTQDPGLIQAFGISPIYLGKNRFDYLIEVETENLLRTLKPDFYLLAKIEGRGIIVTSRSQSRKFDFASRFFAPKAGILGGPVTGSSHC
jgi:predicted PhzF superfamily epimerase YddE/YHI9